MEKTDKKTNTRYKNPEEKRTERMKVAVNSEEKNQLILNAEKLNYASLAEFIRDYGLKNIDQMMIKSHKKESIEMIFQLKKIGNNINQITKYCNANKRPINKFLDLVVENLEKELTELTRILGER